MITLTFNEDASFSSLQSSNPTLYNNILGALNSAISALDSDFSGSTGTYNFNFGWGEDNGNPLTTTGAAIGQSQDNGKLIIPYAVVEAAITATEHQTGSITAQVDFTQHLPTSGIPFGDVYVPVAEAEALGLAGPPTTGNLIGAMGINSADLYTWSGNNPAFGTYAAVSIIEHEITELLGRQSVLLNGADSVLDLMRYTGSGSIDLTNPNIANYLSYDGGVTNIGGLNISSTGDYGDLSGTTHDALSAFTSTGTSDPFSTNDITWMNVLGWNSSGGPSGPPINVYQISAIDNTLDSPQAGAVTDANEAAFLNAMPTTTVAAEITAIVDGSWLQLNGVPVLDAFWLTTTHYSTAATYDGQLGSIQNHSISYDTLCYDDVGSTTFAQVYNGGTLVNPNAALNATILDGLYMQAFGHDPSPSTQAAWLSGGYTMKTAFEAIIESSTYTSYRNASDDSTLTGFADSAEANPASYNGTWSIPGASLQGGGETPSAMPVAVIGSMSLGQYETAHHVTW